MRTEPGKLSMTAQVMEIIRAFMEDGEEHGRKDVVHEIREKAVNKKDLTDGVISGAIKVMIERGEMECVEKGIYKFSLNGGKTELRQKGIRLLTKFQRDLSKLCMVNALQLGEEDMEYIKGLQGLNESIKNNELLMPKCAMEAEEIPAVEMESDVRVSTKALMQLVPEPYPENKAEEKPETTHQPSPKDTSKDTRKPAPKI